MHREKPVGEGCEVVRGETQLMPTHARTHAHNHAHNNGWWWHGVCVGRNASNEICSKDWGALRVRPPLFACCSVAVQCITMQSIALHQPTFCNLEGLLQCLQPTTSARQQPSSAHHHRPFATGASNMVRTSRRVHHREPAPSAYSRPGMWPRCSILKHKGMH